MDVDLWRRAQSLFERALELDPDERKRLLAEACEGDGELARCVDTLFAADRRSEHRLESPPLTEIASILAGDDEAVWTGRRLGAYRILSKLGEGGMGSVFLAERSDQEYEKRVAIKVLRTWWTSSEGLGRFRRERQILAGLDHPNIARLVDGGSTEEGLPYLVMEYVDGVPITAYCDANELTVAERLELFRTVCSAVRFAHQGLVVHRDLKGSNILVRQDGTPKLLDFGIAKLLEADTEAAGQPSTRVLTPDFASPEQVAGRPITTATDVYSLGVLLYELLTGRRPLSWSASSTVAEIERQLLETVPEAPSRALRSERPDGPQPILPIASVAGKRRVRPEALERQLRGDLDNITLRALHKEPEQRYGSVEELSEDLRRHLDGLPVRARPTSWAYRTSRFVRRHRSSVAAALLAVLSLVGFTVHATINSARLARERDIAQRERAEAEQITRFLVDAFEGADPARQEGAELTARQIADIAASRVRFELVEQPDLQASLMTTLGSVYASIGQYDGAAELIAGALDQRRRREPGGGRATAEALHEMAMIEAYRGELAESEEIARQALAMRRREEPDRARESQHLLAKVIGMQDRVDEAIELHLDALSEFEASGSPPDDAYVFGLNELARSYQIVNRLEPAEAILRRAIEAQQRLHPGPHPLTADMLRNLTIVLRHDDRPEQAVEHALRAIEILEALYGEEHALTARMYDTLGTVYRHLEAYDQAEASQRRAIDIQTRLLGADHPEVANSLYNLALLLQRDAGDPDRAEELALESLASSRRSLPPDHVRFGFVLTLLGDVKVSQGRPREALPYLDEALALYRRIYGGVARNWNVAMVESSLGLAHLASGELDRAAEYLERAQPVLDELRGPDNVLSRRCAERRLALYEARGDGSAAAAVRERLGTAPAGLASR